MAIENKVSSFLNKRTWIIPVLFGTMCVLLVTLITACCFRNFSNIKPGYAFSIGMDITAMFAAVMMGLSILPSYKRQSGYIRIFVTLLTIGCFACFSNSLQMLVDGLPKYLWLNKLSSVFIFSNAASYLFFFWLYATYVLKGNGKIVSVLSIVSSAALVIFGLLPFVNIFYPLYFTFDENAFYTQVSSTWWISQTVTVFLLAAIIIVLIISKEKIKTKLIMMGFVGLPLIAMVFKTFFSVNIEYTAMMISLVLIYAFLFSSNERHLYSTNKELGLATSIQKNSLPIIFPPFPERDEFEVYASMNPAKEVGGDFYDFFLIDDNHLGLVMADVSDKGIPAALFMMASKIMIQNTAMLGKSPKEVLTIANRQLCANNKVGMFVTVWLGILDIKTGILTAANAGHEDPVIKQPNGDFTIYKDEHGFVLGCMPEMRYNEYQIKLEKGSKLYVYTDGVPEAKIPSGQYGVERMVDALNKCKDLPVNEIVHSMEKDIKQYVGEHEQFDDITMLCFEYKGSSPKIAGHSETPAKVENIDNLINPIIDALNEDNVDSKIIYKIRLSLEELITNVALYAYKPDSGEVIVDYELSENPHQIEVTITDNGKPFNPLQVEDPDFTISVKDRRIGGLGLFIVKNTMDEVIYKRENNQNILKIKKNL